MTIYTDAEYKCHASEGDGWTAHDVPFFDNRCTAFIEGYRYVPAGESWTRADGVVFSGEMIAPAMDYSKLAAAQGGYDEAQGTIAEYEAALSEIETALGV